MPKEICEPFKSICVAADPEEVDFLDLKVINSLVMPIPVKNFLFKSKLIQDVKSWRFFSKLRKAFSKNLLTRLISKLKQKE